MSIFGITPFKTLIYLSLAFLLWALYSGGYAYVPEIHHPGYLVLSSILLVLAFSLETIPWRSLASSGNRRVSLRDSFISIGLSILGKYIPGKIWAVVGRATYLSQRYSIPIGEMNTRSLKAQLVVIWSGFIIGSLVLVQIDTSPGMLFIVLLAELAVSLLLFTHGINTIWAYFGRLLRKPLKPLPKISLGDLAPLIPFYLLQWMFWCVAFYFFTTALTRDPVSPAIGLSFALAAVLGIVMLFTPGGIGVREGILAAALVALGLDSEKALSISIASRLWFLSGECAIFLMAVAMSYFGTEKNR